MRRVSVEPDAVVSPGAGFVWADDVIDDDLIDAVAEGRADIAGAGLTITPERERQVDFSAPWTEDVKEIAKDILRHRVLQTYEAEAEDMNPDMVIEGRPAGRVCAAAASRLSRQRVVRQQQTRQLSSCQCLKPRNGWSGSVLLFFFFFFCHDAGDWLCV